MAKKIFPMYIEEAMHERYKKMYDAKYNHMSFYAMFIELSLPALEKFEKVEAKK
jgi:hypothetical protein